MKIDKSKEAAIEQIKTNKYYQKFVSRNKKVVLIGISFDSKQRNIDSWLSESLSD
jgi:hypothetical protein